MSKFYEETVTYVHHWNDTLFTLKTTRNAGLRFRNGEFAMIGLEVNGKPLMRAYSIASTNYDEELEFYSIKVQDGPLTSILQHIKVGDKLLVSKKPTGTLVLDDLNPGKHLYMLATGTGLAPFLSLARDPEVYERFEKVIVVHGVRYVSELGYREMFEKDLFEDELLGEYVKDKLIYYPTVTREPFRNEGRMTDLMKSGKLFQDIGLPPINPSDDTNALSSIKVMSLRAGISWLMVHQPIWVSWHWVKTCVWRSCLGTATTSKTRFCYLSVWLKKIALPPFISKN